MNRLSDTLRPDSVDIMKRLCALSSKHGPSLADGGYATMNIFEHPERAMDSVFGVAMRLRHKSTRPETGFYLYDAGHVLGDDAQCGGVHVEHGAVHVLREGGEPPVEGDEGELEAIYATHDE